MTEPVLRLEPTKLSVDPGASVSLVVTVRNPGKRVEGYDLDLVSVTPMPWTTIAPPNLQVYPDQEESAVVTFAPPAGPEAPGGTFPFGVRARSRVDAEAGAVAEGDLDVGAVAGLRATLAPVTSSGRWSGRHTLTVANWGNSPARLRISPRDPDEALGFLVSPQLLEVPLGTEAVARLKVRTRHPVLRGTRQRLPFQVECEPEEPESLGAAAPGLSTPERPVVDGAFNQKPILTRATVAVAGLVLLAGAGGITWAATRPNSATAEVAPAPNAPTGFTVVPETDRVVLAWDRDRSVDSYVLQQLDPASARSAVSPAVDPDDAARMELKVAVTTADSYCYQLMAVRHNAPPSPPTKAACVETRLSKKAAASPKPGATKSIIPIPTGGRPTSTSTASQSASSPSTSQSGTSASQGSTTPPTSGEPSGPPKPFVSVIKFYSLGSTTEARQDQRTLLADGVQARVLSSQEWTFTPALAKPLLALVVDAPSQEEATAKCQQALRVAPDVVDAHCLPRQVSSSTSP